jgi:hypothetical protein
MTDVDQKPFVNILPIKLGQYFRGNIIYTEISGDNKFFLFQKVVKSQKSKLQSPKKL